LPFAAGISPAASSASVTVKPPSTARSKWRVDQGTLDPSRGSRLGARRPRHRGPAHRSRWARPWLRLSRPAPSSPMWAPPKSEIVRRFEELLAAGVSFVGAHPIAGSEKRGIDAARPDLFQKCVCVLTPTDATDPKALRRVSDLWTGVGARVCTLSCEEHDDILARDLPPAASRRRPHSSRRLRPPTPVSSVPDFATPPASPRATSTSGATSSDQSRRVLDALAGFTDRMAELRRAVESGDRAKLADLLAAAKSRRDSLSPE